jgi:hypothetical protein
MFFPSLYSGTGKKQEIEPKQEVKITDNVVNTPLIVRAVACQAARVKN